MISQEELNRLLPHRPPVRLVNNVLRHEPDLVEVEARLASAALFRSKAVPSAWCLEVMAQAAAIWFNFGASAPAWNGRLIQARNVEFAVDSLPRGTRLRVLVRALSASSQGFHLFKGEAFAGEDAHEEFAASASFAILRLPDDEPQRPQRT